MSKVEVVRAHVAGQKAAREGAPMTSCPHKADAPDALTRALARMWLRGYAKVKPTPVDYSG